ncbi:MAG: ABC transporter permease [Segetibacter sp.]
MGYGSGFLIYITLLIYGTMVMRGVSEEKTNRIAEVVISSVKPFQLMIGKIVGIGAVGLTQFLIWIILLVGLMSAASCTFIKRNFATGAGVKSANAGRKRAGRIRCCK